MHRVDLQADERFKFHVCGFHSGYLAKSSDGVRQWHKESLRQTGRELERRWPLCDGRLVELRVNFAADWADSETARRSRRTN
jgi:hypothetical protein